MRLVKFFDKLNTPVVATVVLILALAVNGFLLFRQPAPLTTNVATKTESAVSEDPTTTPDSTVAEGSGDSEDPDAASGSTVAEGSEDSEGTTAASDRAVLEEAGDEEPEETAPDVPAAPETPVSGNLGEFIRGCSAERKECARGFVAQAAPEARYIGGRTDLSTGGPGRNTEILYFEDPSLNPCEYARQDSEVEDGLIYTVIVVGQGSFDSERGSACIPEA